MIDRLYPMALDCGISCRDFWELSIAEIIDAMDSHSRREKRRTKERLSELHFLAKDIAQYIGLTFGGKEGERGPELWDYFPGLFEDERAEVETYRHRQELAAYKAQMCDFVYRHNSRKTGGEQQRTE